MYTGIRLETFNGKCRFESRLCNLIELNIQLAVYMCVYEYIIIIPMPCLILLYILTVYS